MTMEQIALRVWGVVCVAGGLVIDHRAVIAVGVVVMGAWAIWLSNQEGR